MVGRELVGFARGVGRRDLCEDVLVPYQSCVLGGKDGGGCGRGRSWWDGVLGHYSKYVHQVTMKHKLAGSPYIAAAGIEGVRVSSLLSQAAGRSAQSLTWMSALRSSAMPRSRAALPADLPVLLQHCVRRSCHSDSRVGRRRGALIVRPSLVSVYRSFLGLS